MIAGRLQKWSERSEGRRYPGRSTASPKRDRTNVGDARSWRTPTARLYACCILPDVHGFDKQGRLEQLTRLRN